MAVTQYIGARYVPLVYQNPDDNTNNWKQGVAYDPLTMVTYAGGSYTSKTFVPTTAANPIDAPQYWIYMGSSSGQITVNTNSITKIRHALAAATEAGYICTSDRANGDFVWIDGVLYECTDDINVNDSYVPGINIVEVTDALHALISGLGQASSDISDISNDLDTLEGTVTTLTGTVGTIQTQSNADHAVITTNGLKKMTYAIWIGDSYTMAGSLGVNVDKRFSTLVSNWLGLTEKNYGVGSCGFIKGATPYTAQLQNAINEFDNDGLNKQEVGYVFISSCRNDTNYGTRNDIINATRSMVQDINANFPNAKIYITPLLWDWKVVYYNSRIFDYIAGIKTAADYGDNVHIIDYGWEWLMGNADKVLYENGGDVHPSVFGHKIIADYIWSALQGNNRRRYEFGQINPTATAAGLTDMVIFYEVMDGYINLSMKFKNTGGSSITTGNVWELAINNIYFQNFFVFNDATDQVFFDLICREQSGSISPTCKAFITGTCTKTGDTAGSMLLRCALYGNGALQNGATYHASLRIPYGRKTEPRMT